MSLLQEFVLWFAQFVAVSVTLLTAVFLYGRRQRLKAKRAADREEAEQRRRSGGMSTSRRSR